MLRASWVRSAACCALLGWAVFGCSKPGLKTHPVVGKVEVKNGDVQLLTGSGVEFVSDVDETIRPTGNFDAAGNFTIKTLHQGEIIEGAPPGTYKARIILADPGDEGVPKRTGNPIHPRYLEFRTSGLTVTVPSSDYTLRLSK